MKPNEKERKAVLAEAEDIVNKSGCLWSKLVSGIAVKLFKLREEKETAVQQAYINCKRIANDYTHHKDAQMIYRRIQQAANKAREIK